MSDIDLWREIHKLRTLLDRLRTTDAVSGSGSPTGLAGGVLGGTYPDPDFAVDMATQAELNTHTGLTTTAHGGIVASTDPRLTDSRAPNGSASGDLTGTYPGPTVAADAITYAKMQNVSVTDRVLGRSTAGAGNVEEITFTAAARALADDADAAAQRTTLGLGAAALLATPIAVASGGSGADLSATGGASQFVRQSTTGAVFTVSAIVRADLPLSIHARVYNDAALTIANNTVTALTFNSERTDTDGFHSTASNTERLTIPFTGTYAIFGHATWNANAVGIRDLWIDVDDTTIIAEQIVAPPSSVMSMSIATLYTLTAGQWLRLIGYQNSGGNLNINVAANYTPEFAVVYLGRA